MKYLFFVLIIFNTNKNTTVHLHITSTTVDFPNSRFLLSEIIIFPVVENILSEQKNVAALHKNFLTSFTNLEYSFSQVFHHYGEHKLQFLLLLVTKI